MIVGEGKYRYEVVEGWGRIPAGWHLDDVPDVAVDAQDRVYLFNRSEHPVIVLDREGRFLGSWGEGVFARAHGVTVSRDGVVYCTDDMDHTVRMFTLEGRLLTTLGTKGHPSDSGYVVSAPYHLATIQRGAGPFNRPTKVAIAPDGDLYITDGYGNARVHRFSADGQLKTSWGEPGEGPGQFKLPHSAWVHTDGRVYVCDRENGRIQIFDAGGHFLDAWTDVGRPMELVIDQSGTVFIAAWHWWPGDISLAGQPKEPTPPLQMIIRDLDGTMLAAWGGTDATAVGACVAAHGLCLDSHGDLYVVEVAKQGLVRRGQYRPEHWPVHKYARM
jgi:sugar lactone lactonase YvrE